MTQSPQQPVPGPPRAAQVGPVQPSTPADVEQVLHTLERLEELPVAEHVAVFEQAHASLRRALDEAGAGQPART